MNKNDAPQMPPSTMSSVGVTQEATAVVWDGLMLDMDAKVYRSEATSRRLSLAEMLNSQHASFRKPESALNDRAPSPYPVGMMSGVEIAVSIALGVGLAAAVGFRVFVPLLVASVAAYTGHLHISESFAWLGTLPATITLGVAAAAEVAAYYIPGVDHLLDVIVSPIAVVAGALVSAAVIVDLPPLVKWATAIIAGGGAAALTQSITALLRVKSTATTAGLANPVVASAELGSSLVISLLALVVPLLAVAAVIVLVVFVLRRVRRTRSRF
jgi:hypothetical protein